MKVKQILEAKYGGSKERKLEGYFIAGNKNDRITIIIGDFKDVGRGKTHARIVDWESVNGFLVHYYKDALEPGTEVEFGEARGQWYIMPMTDNPATGWFIRGPDLFIDEAKYHGVDNLVDCPNCLGRGWEYVVLDLEDVEKDICHFCDGEGQVREEKVLALQKRRAEAKHYIEYD